MLEEYIYEQVAAQQLAPERARLLLDELAQTLSAADDIAIIGVACRFPGANDAGEFWDNLVRERCSIGYFPEQRSQDVEHVWTNPACMQFLMGKPYRGPRDAQSMFDKNGYLADCDTFDADFFGIPPREATFMDPMQRKFLETAWEAVEDAGYGGTQLHSTRTGVFAGRLTDLVLYRYMSVPDPLHLTGSWEGILASRVSYLFNFRGPAMVVDTACSSGLVSVHLGCQAIRRGECELALAGGICIGFGALKQDRGPMDMKAVESADGEVRTFDDGATGTTWGEGVGVVLLKPLRRALEDRDNIYATIKGSGVNNDGASNGITAPNAAAQEELLSKVWKDAGIDAATISYVEAHGTGTALGDPIEVRALSNAFAQQTSKKQFCGVGSVKTNIGHTVGASGMASLIKVLMAMRNQQLPATLNFSKPNRHIDFVDSPLFVNDSLRRWESPEGQPRRAGVSAFGFSGTNAHLLVEEAPMTAETLSEMARGPWLLPISAKTQAGLERLLERYVRYFERERPKNVADVCHTAAVGRGHHEHRVALVGSSVDDFLQQLREIATTGIGEDRRYGAHRVVNARSSQGATNELTRSELEALSGQGKQVLDRASSSTLEELASLYLRGAELDFPRLWGNRGGRRVSIPTYPYERRRLWAPKKDFEVTEGSKLLEHPLLDRMLGRSPTQAIYSTRLDPERHWPLSDHRVAGESVLPGTAYLELAVALASLELGPGSVTIENVTFLAPLEVLSESERELLSVVEPRADGFAVTFVTAGGEEGAQTLWTEHASLQVRRCGEPQPRLDVQRELALFSGEATRSAQPASDELLGLSGRWEHDRVLRVREGSCLGELALAEKYAADCGSFHLHPALMDSAVNIFDVPQTPSPDGADAKGGQPAVEQALYLPIAYERLKVHAKLPPRFWSKLTLRGQPTPGAKVLSADLTLFDGLGNIVVEIQGYSLKRFTLAALGRMRDPELFAIEWRQVPMPVAAREQRWGSVALIGGQDQVTSRVEEYLRSRADSLTRVELDAATPTAPSVEQAHLRCSPDASGLTQLVKELLRRKVNQLVFVSPASACTHDLSTFRAQEHAGVLALFHLLKAVLEQKLGPDPELHCIGVDASAVRPGAAVDPLGASFLALANVAAAEYPHVHVTTVDVDASAQPECYLAAPRATRRAYRGDACFRPTLETTRGDENAPLPQLGGDGVCVITGGTGGVGRCMATYLAERGAQAIALLSRSEPIAREQWQRVATEGGQGSDVVKTLLELERRGVAVSWCQADVGDEHSLRNALGALRNEFGRIRAVLHCAGVAGDGFLLNKDPKAFESVLRPKVEGTWLLDELTRADEPELFLLFSSVFALIGAPGQGDYAAGNAYLDAFAAARKGRGQTLSLNWPAWNEVGMAVDRGLSGEQLFESVSNSEAAARLDRALALGMRQLLPARIDFRMLAQAGDAIDLELSSELKALRSRHAQQRRPETKDWTLLTPEQVTLRGRADSQYDEYERKLGALWASALGITELDIHDNYHSLGGDSLMAQRLIKAIEPLYPGAVDITDLFSFPSVAQLAAEVKQRVEHQHKDTEPQATTVKDIESMLDNLDDDASIDQLLSSLT